MVQDQYDSLAARNKELDAIAWLVSPENPAVRKQYGILHSSLRRLAAR
jgi:hypothetical protein